MVSMEVITSVVIKGVSLRIKVPGVMVQVARRPLPFPGMASIVKRPFPNVSEVAPFCEALVAEGVVLLGAMVCYVCRITVHKCWIKMRGIQWGRALCSVLLSPLHDKTQEIVFLGLC